MIRGYFLRRGLRLRPFVDVALWFPAFGGESIEVPVLIDTGADRTILAPNDARQLTERLGVDLAELSEGAPSTGVGGHMATRTIEAVLEMDRFVSDTFSLIVLEPRRGETLSIPSLLGRDILASFALFLEERTGRVLLLEPHEADALPLP